MAGFRQVLSQNSRAYIDRAAPGGHVKWARDGVDVRVWERDMLGAMIERRVFTYNWPLREWECVVTQRAVLARDLDEREGRANGAS